MCDCFLFKATVINDENLRKQLLKIADLPLDPGALRPSSRGAKAHRGNSCSVILWLYAYLRKDNPSSRAAFNF